MKRIALVLAMVLAPVSAFAQCSGVFPAGTVCGAVVQGPPKPIQASSIANVNLIVGTTTVSGINLEVLTVNAGKLAQYTNTQLTALINLATSALSGALPAWPNNITTYFRGDGTYATLNCAALTTPCITGNQTITISGDVSGVGATSILTAVSPNAITNAKLAQALPNTFKGNTGSAIANVGDNTFPDCPDTGGNHLNKASGLAVTCGTTTTGSAVVLLNTLTASSSISLSDTTSFTGTYTSYQIVFSGILPNIGATSCLVRVHSGGTFQATSYLSTYGGNAGGGAFFGNSSTVSVPCSDLASTSTSGGGISGTIVLYNPSTSALHNLMGDFTYFNGTSITRIVSGGYWNSVAVVDGIQISFTAGGVQLGTIKIYGVL